MIRTVITDMDGTLIDSEGAIALAGKEALVDWGICCQLPDFLPFTGRGDDRFIGGVSEKYGVPYDPAMKLRAYEIYDATADERIRVFDWSERLLAFFKARGMKLGIASAADRFRVERNIKRLGFSPEDFDAVTSANDVTRQKPDPDVFLRAMEKMGADPRETVIFEDATMGVRAAKAAGAYCIAVTTSYDAEALYREGADLVMPDPARICDILEIFG